MTYFKDGNGFLDIPNRIIGRWVWSDWKPYAQWMVKWAWEWTANDLYGLTDDEWETVFVLSTPNPNARSPEQRIADDLYWKKKTPDAWYKAKKFHEELPKRTQEYKIRL